MSVERRPMDQIVIEGQNAIFECRLNGNNGQLLPVQWSIQMVDSPPDPIITNTTQYYILPPANSLLVFVNADLSFSGVSVRCSVLDTQLSAVLAVQGEFNVHIDCH